MFQIVAIFASFLLCACGSGGVCELKPGSDLESVTEENKSNLKDWKRSRPKEYTLLVKQYCFCPDMWWISTVNASGSHGFQWGYDGYSVGFTQSNEWRSVEDAFASVDDMVSDDPDELSVTYDSKRSFPSKIYSDYDYCWYDDEVTFRLELIDVDEASGLADAYLCDSKAVSSLTGSWVPKAFDKGRGDFDWPNPVSIFVQSNVIDLFLNDNSKKRANYSLIQNSTAQYCLLSWSYEDPAQSWMTGFLASISESAFVLWNPSSKTRITFGRH